MPITAKCNSCAAQFKVKDEWAGKRVKCPKCSEALVIPKPQQASVPVQNDPYQLAPPVSRPAANPMLDLLDDAGVESTPRGPVCPTCGVEVSPTAVVCVECGYNIETGKQLETVTYREVGETDAGMSDAEKMLARAEKEIDEMPVSASQQDFGDGADSYFITFAALIVAGVLVAIGVGVIFVMDKVGENVNTALISMCGSIAIYLFCAVWITFFAFRAKALHGLGCLFSGGLYSIIFGFMQGRALMLPAGICSFSILIGIVSYLVFAAGD